jgi:hypothetical protein
MQATSVDAKAESLRSFGLIAAGVVATLVVYAVAIMLVVSGWQERGQFGDMFGAANTLFSGLAFTALVYALLLQRTELGLQRTELSLTRAELSKQSEAQTQQAQTALRAAKISALGALLQSYAQLLQSGHTSLVHPTSYPDEMLRVREDLRRLLGETDA